jgi:hypothetical protein
MKNIAIMLSNDTLAWSACFNACLGRIQHVCTGGVVP